MAEQTRCRRAYPSSKMSHVVWSPDALADIVRLHSFLAEHESAVADRAAETIRDGVRLLSQFLASGRPVPEGGSYREWIIRFGRGAYVVTYEIIENVAVIGNIRHNREQ